MSAFLSSTSYSVPCSGNTLTPTLAVTEISCAVHLERHGELLADANGDGVRRAHIAHAGGDHARTRPPPMRTTRSVAATLARNRSAAICSSLSPQRVTVKVVDLLEVVDVEMEEGDGAFRAIGLLDDVLEPVLQAHAVEQSGERVVMHDLRQPLLVVDQRAFRRSFARTRHAARS